MYEITVKSLVWTENGGDRDFHATYFIDDGYRSFEEVLGKVKGLSYDYRNFVYLKVHGEWYALWMDSYFSCVIITAEAVYIQKEAFRNATEYNMSDAENNDLPFKNRELEFDPGNKLWSEGIVEDLTKNELLDNAHTLMIYDYRYMPLVFCSLIYNNALARFGLTFFATEIRIERDSYVRRILSHYYNPISLAYKMADIDKVRGYAEYYNPFSGETSRNYNESHKKIKEKEKLIKENDSEHLYIMNAHFQQYTDRQQKIIRDEDVEALTNAEIAKLIVRARALHHNDIIDDLYARYSGIKCLKKYWK